MEKGVLSASRLINWKINSGVLKYPIPPKKIILSAQHIHIQSKLFSKRRRIRGLIGKHLCINESTGTYLGTGWGIGSPAMIALCEEYYALGVRFFCIVGMVGRISGQHQEGEIIYAKSAISEEGTSRHYGHWGTNELETSLPSRMITQLDQNGIKPAKFVSTDAPFRETISKLSNWRTMGASIVDMETSALYAFARHYNVPAISIGIAADSLASNEWNQPKNFTEITKNLAKAANWLSYII